jgi:ABC-type lipoprotein release transport system permease subunit
MSLYLRLAWRNVWRQRRKTLLIAGAMGVIVSFLMIYDGIIGGFEQGIYGNAIQVMGGNIQVHAPGYQEKTGSKPLLPMDNPDGIIQAAESHPDVVMAIKRIITSGLVTNREGAFSVTMIGLEPEKEAQISIEAKNISAGRYLTPDDGDLIVIGQGLASLMDVKVNDRITMVGNSTHKQTRQRTMTVVGIYDIGVPTIEKNTIYMSLGEAQQLFGLDGQVTVVVVNLAQIGQEAGVVKAINAAQPGYEIETWETSSPELKQAIEMDKTMMGVFGIIMLGIAAIGILNLLMMAVFERTREIGVLGALGLKPRQITLLFLLEGVLIGAAGAVLGAILGTIFSGALSYFGFDFSAYADMADYTALLSDRFYPQFVPLKALRHGLTVLIIAALAAISPARQAARQEPAEALHYV